jgi:hypothetical protein
LHDATEFGADFLLRSAARNIVEHHLGPMKQAALPLQAGQPSGQCGPQTGVVVATQKVAFRAAFRAAATTQATCSFGRMKLRRISLWSARRGLAEFAGQSVCSGGAGGVAGGLSQG